jgi:hypothetical protein
MELYIKTSQVFDSGINEAGINEYIFDATKSWTEDIYIGYYVYIYSGISAGFLTKIVSNNTNQLFFETYPSDIPIDSIYQIIDFTYKRVEMFQDEKVSVTSTIQNYSDIGKLFTDYSQSFTIPASPINNAIFSHWYDNAVDNGYDARIRYNAYIEIDTLPFRQGNVQLEKANKKNGYIESYTLTFYGNLTQLKDKFGDDKLNSLDYSSLNHTYDASTVISKINTNTGGVKYPLIGNDRKFDYKTATIYDVTTNTGAINWNDLFPAVPVTTILNFIQTKYNITFTGNFFGYSQFNKLNMLFKNSELPRAYNAGINFVPNRFVHFQSGTTTTFPEYNSTTNLITSNWSSNLFPNYLTPTTPRRIIIKFKTIPNTGFTATNYRVDLFQDGVLYKTFDNLVGTNDVELYNQTQSEDPANHTYYVRVYALGAFNFKGQLIYIRRGGGDYTTDAFNYTSGGATGQSFSAIQNIVNYAPDIKVSDFFMGLVKMFNLIITPLDATTFKLEPLELYYQAGQIKDLTPYIYADELDIEKPKLFKSIEFTYEKSENILNNAFRGLFNREYGDLLYDSGSNSESGKYEVKLPFEDVMFERATGYNFQTATLLNKDLQSYTPKPILMYNNGLSDISAFPIKIFNGSGYTNVNNYVRFNNEINTGGTDLGYLYSINFGAEISSWYLVTASKGLYKRHYEQYILNLYNQKTRVLKIKAKLEPQNLTSLKLNDRIIIRDNRYIINSFTTDLTTGEATFELINDYRTLGYNSVGYRYSNIEMLNVDNTAQDIQIDIYKGMFKYISVSASSSGFATWTGSGTQEEDFSTTISIAQNTSGIERTKDFEIKFEDYDGNIIFVQVPITQDL